MSDYTPEDEELPFDEYVTIKTPDKDPFARYTFNGGFPTRIAWDTEEYVVVVVNSLQQLPISADPLVTKTGDTLKDEDGNYLVGIPASECNFLTGVEAQKIRDLIK